MKQEKHRKFSVKSAASPTDAELAEFEDLSIEDQRAFLEAELDKGLKSGTSGKSVNEILREVKARHRKHAL